MQICGKMKVVFFGVFAVLRRPLARHGASSRPTKAKTWPTGDVYLVGAQAKEENCITFSFFLFSNMCI